MKITISTRAALEEGCALFAYCEKILLCLLLCLWEGRHHSARSPAGPQVLGLQEGIRSIQLVFFQIISNVPHLKP